MDIVNATAAIIGLINGLKLFELPDKKSFYYFLASVIIGAVFGVVHIFKLDLETGILLGLSASGYYKIALKIGGIQ